MLWLSLIFFYIRFQSNIPHLISDQFWVLKYWIVCWRVVSRCVCIWGFVGGNVSWGARIFRKEASSNSSPGRHPQAAPRTTWNCSAISDCEYLLNLSPSSSYIFVHLDFFTPATAIPWCTAEAFRLLNGRSHLPELTEWHESFSKGYFWKTPSKIYYFESSWHKPRWAVN